MSCRRFLPCLALVLAFAAGFTPARANIPGGGTGTGQNVTLTTSGSNFIMNNGVVSITGGQSSATITNISYTYNNSGSSTTTNLLSGGHNGGQMYWSWTPAAGQQGPSGTYRVVVDPAVGDANHAPGDYAEVAIYTTWGGNSSLGWADVDVHYSMTRGSPGFYASAIHIRKNTYAASTMAEWRSNIYPGSTFDWLNVDSVKTLQMASPSSSAAVVANAPQEVFLWTSGLYNGRYEDKYDYSADLGDESAWGWTSVTNSTAGFSGKNVGLWVTLPSKEYYNGGPMKKELICHQGPTELNMLNGTHYGMGQDYVFATNEPWVKTFGPYFVYCNSAPTSITDPAQASATMFADAQAQAAAEQGAWPYSWFVNGNYTPASGRGNVTGRIVINDTYNPNASAAGLWVGVAQTPVGTTTFDFQEWCKGYEFWVKTDANGNFTIPYVIAGSNYTLFAFGPGAAGTFQSQVLKSTFNYYQLDIPSTPFSVTVTGGQTNNLGAVTWTPKRVGPTVFEIGVPDRNATEFRHGDDYWRGGIGPSPSSPSPIWAQHIVYPFDFPNGVNYTVGASRWSTDWNWVQPCITNAAGSFSLTSNSNITFTLPAAPSATSSLYIATAADVSGPLVIKVNNINITSGNVTSNGQAISASTSGYTPTTFSTSNDAVIRQGIHGAFADDRISIPASVLRAGPNTINILMNKTGSNEDCATYDYVRLEVPGYIPPAPAGVAAYPGNNQILLSWPATAGATSYNILRSTTTGSGYASLVSGVTGPVTGSGPGNATYVDSTAANGTPYYYVVQSVNPVGTSANSTQGTATADAGLSASAPATPTGLAASVNPGNLTVTWAAAPGASYYTVRRATYINSNGAQLYTTLSNTVTGTSFVDATPTLGTPYAYTVAATNAAGTSAFTSAALGTMLDAAAPASPPSSITVSPGTGQITLSWAAVSGALAYVIERATSNGGPYTLLGTVVGTSYNDTGNTNSGGSITGSTLANGTTYYYLIAAMNTAGASAFATQVSGTTAPSAPVLAGAGNTGNVTLSWGSVSGAANYTVRRATSSGGSYSTIASAVTGATYTDTGRTNGTSYFYEVESVSSGGGVSAASNEVGVTPMAIPAAFTAQGNSASVTLSWTAVTKAGFYNLERGTASGGPYALVTNVSSPSVTFTDASVTNGIQYFYVLAASNSTVDGTVTAASLSVNSTEVAATPLAAPTGVGATAFSGNATLTWTAVTGATSYAVRRSTTNGSGYVTINSTVAGTPFVDNGLTNGTTYYYVVAAQAVNGLSANSTQVSATPQGIPGSVTAIASTGTVALTWSAAAGVSSYVVKRGTATGGPYTTLTSGASIAGYTDTAVVNGTPYFYVVAGLNSSGVGANSAEVSATPLAPPANLTATAGNGNISLTWSAAAGATAYTIKRATTSGAETVLATGVSATNYKDTTAVNGTPYFYTVTATNSNGASGSSSETSATPAGSPPSVPTNLVLTPGESNVTLNWSAASGAATYIVQRSDTTGTGYVTINGAVATTSYLDTGLTDGNTYYYVVAAQNPAGTSANSAEANTTLAQNITAWTAASFPGVTDANITGPAATPENDGVPNLLKYFYGLDPAAPAPANNPPVTSTTGPTNTVLFTFRLAKSATGLAYSIQSSTDLLNWTDTGVTPSVLSDQGTYYIMQASVPLGANPSLYLRLKVTTP